MGVSIPVVVPEHVAGQRGTTYWDPLATLSSLAARTSLIRLATSVLVLVVEPCAVQPHVPVWVGTRTLRRATALAAGWMPFGPSSTELRKMLAGVDLPAGLAALSELTDDIEGVDR